MRPLRADLHLHSSVSDGRDRPEQLVVAAVEKEIDVIAVTDHDTFEGGLRARRYAESTGYEVLVLVGAEVRSDWGDILVICGEEGLDRIPRNPYELVELARENGCLVIPAHPFDIRRKGIGSKVFQMKWDAIEVYNAHSDPLANKRAMEVARELGIPGIAASDAHVASSIGAAYTSITASDASVEEVMEAIRKGHIHPVPGRPSARAVLEAIGWSIRRRVSRHDERRLQKLEELESQYHHYYD